MLNENITVCPGLTVGVMNPFRILFAYEGPPGFRMGSAAQADDRKRNDIASARAARPAFIARQKPSGLLYGFRSSQGRCPGNVIILASIGNFVLGARVDRSLAERFRKELSSIHTVDTTRLIADDGRYVVIPLVAVPSDEMLTKFGATIIEAIFPLREIQKDPIDQVIETVRMPEPLKSALPRKWERFGDVLVLRLDPSLDRYEREIAEAYSAVLNTKSVLRDVGGVSGDFRQPITRLLLGSDTVTTHLENGVRFRFDVEKIMFSSGNVEERARMAEIKCDGETIVDMFAGIGYFSIPIAMYQKPSRVIACEINPIAHSYLVENISINKVEHVVEPYLGDNRALPGDSFADRVIMGYVKTTHEFLPTALRLLKDGGLLHYHETCPNELLPDRPVQHLKTAANGGKVIVERLKEIKSYSPGVSHVVVDARVFRPA
jgi:tRNA wybutosine-synthesizing protein 2